MQITSCRHTEAFSDPYRKNDRSFWKSGFHFGHVSNNYNHPSAASAISCRKTFLIANIVVQVQLCPVRQPPTPLSKCLRSARRPENRVPLYFRRTKVEQVDSFRLRTSSAKTHAKTHAEMPTQKTVCPNTHVTEERLDANHAHNAPSAIQATNFLKPIKTMHGSQPASSKINSRLQPPSIRPTYSKRPNLIHHHPLKHPLPIP